MNRRGPGKPLAVILAGGAARRMGGAKAAAELDGRPLISYPLEALRQAFGTVAVLAKADSKLPPLPGVPFWQEPDSPRHPLMGLVHALKCARGRPVLVCAADLPFVSAELALALAEADPAGAPAVVACAKETIQPLLGCYQPEARELLAPAATGELRVLDAVLALAPTRYEVREETVLFNVNTPEDLGVAEAMLRRRGGVPSRT